MIIYVLTMDVTYHRFCHYTELGIINPGELKRRLPGDKNKTKTV